MAQSWQSNFGTLCLKYYTTLHEGSRKHVPMFSRVEVEDRKKRIRALGIACIVLGVNKENIFVRLFVEFLIISIVSWCQHLEEGSIARWKVLEYEFLVRFK